MEIDYSTPRRHLQEYITATAHMEMLSLEKFVL